MVETTFTSRRNRAATGTGNQMVCMSPPTTRKTCSALGRDGRHRPSGWGRRCPIESSVRTPGKGVCGSKTSSTSESLLSDISAAGVLLQQSFCIFDYRFSVPVSHYHCNFFNECELRLFFPVFRSQVDCMLTSYPSFKLEGFNPRDAAHPRPDVPHRFKTPDARPKGFKPLYPVPQLRRQQI